MNYQSTEVIKKLLARREGKKDNYKIGIIFQGGGMRASFGGGVAKYLEENGFADLFDVVYGTSAGSCIGAYMLSHRTKTGAPIFWKDLSGNRFIKPWKFPKMMDLDYFCDRVMGQDKPLDFDRIKNSKTLYKICVTQKETGELKFFTNRDEVNLLQAIKASCTYPGFFYPIVKIGGKGYLEGDANRLLPLEEVENDGCTDLLIVATVIDTYQKQLKAIPVFIHQILMLPLGNNFRQSFKKRFKDYNNRLDFIFGRKKFYKNINLFTISPDLQVRNSETNAEVLEKISNDGYKKARQAFEG